MNNAVEYINENANIEQLLKYYNFKNTNPSGNYIRSSCAIHGGSNPTAFVFNLENKLWFCHTGCQKGGDIYELIMEMEGISFPEAVHRASEIFELDITKMRIERTEKGLKNTNKWIDFMKKKVTSKEIKELNIDNYTLYDVNKFRNFNKETLKYFGIKYAKDITLQMREKKTTFYNRIVIPVYFDNKLVMLAIRKTKLSDTPKWLNYPPGFDTGNILYNYDNATSYMKENKVREIIVVEGIFDVMKFYEANIQNVVCTFGAHLTKEQEKLIMKVAENLVLCYDNDKAGKKATKKAISSMKYKTNLSIIELNEGKDPEEHTLDELIYKYNDKIHYSRWLKAYN